MRRGAISFRCSRIASSSTPKSIHWFALETPMPLGEAAEAFGGVAAPARAGERRHARIVPALDVAFLDELDQLALARART